MQPSKVGQSSGRCVQGVVVAQAVFVGRKDAMGVPVRAGPRRERTEQATRTRSRADLHGFRAATRGGLELETRSRRHRWRTSPPARLKSASSDRSASTDFIPGSNAPYRRGARREKPLSVVSERGTRACCPAHFPALAGSLSRAAESSPVRPEQRTSPELVAPATPASKRTARTQRKAARLAVGHLHLGPLAGDDTEHNQGSSDHFCPPFASASSRLLALVLALHTADEPQRTDQRTRPHPAAPRERTHRACATLPAPLPTGLSAERARLSRPPSRHRRQSRVALCATLAQTALR